MEKVKMHARNEPIKSIKKRLVVNFMLVVFISVVFLNILLINFVKQYYYQNVEDVLSNQIMISSEFYSRYFSNSSLEDNVLENIDIFWKQTPAQVQIIDLSGKVLMDSIGVVHKEPIKSKDVIYALAGEKGTFIGKVEYDDENILAVSYPLKDNNKIIGALRFITSLKEVDKGIMRISLVFLSIGGIVILVSGLVSIFLAGTITGPIKEVTAVAHKMALGNFKIRSHKKFNDEIGKLSDTLNFMAEEIIKKDQLKNEFISSVSHELRTPLTAIKGWAILLNQNHISDHQTLKEGLNIVEKESERLTGMVEELLDFSKFVSGKITLNKEEILLKDLMEYIKNCMGPRAVRDNIEFEVIYDETTNPIFIDKNRMTQVLINILDNAFKFTGNHGHVSVLAQHKEENLFISIKDNGCGISRRDLPKVKEKFYKGKNSKSKNGIGLSICDEIVRLHGGELNIMSKVNKGTTVEVQIPIKNI